MLTLVSDKSNKTHQCDVLHAALQRLYDSPGFYDDPENDVSGTIRALVRIEERLIVARRLIDSARKAVPAIPIQRTAEELIERIDDALDDASGFLGDALRHVSCALERVDETVFSDEHDTDSCHADTESAMRHI